MRNLARILLNGLILLSAYSPTSAFSLSENLLLSGIGPRCNNREYWDQIDNSFPSERIISIASSLIENPLPPWSKEDYLEYSINGSRKRGEEMLQRRLSTLFPLVLAECIEWKGRFLPFIEKSFHSLLNQPSWVLPAHDISLTNLKATTYTIDIFSSDMAREIVQASYMLEEKLPYEVSERVRKVVEERITAPLERSIRGQSKDNSWIHRTDNWLAVCLDGSLAASLGILSDRTRRRAITTWAAEIAGNYLKSYMSDGFPAEGPAYWNYGFVHYLLLRETLLASEQHTVDLLHYSSAKQAIEFGRRFQMRDDIMSPISDSSQNIRVDSFIKQYLSILVGHSSKWTHSELDWFRRQDTRLTRASFTLWHLPYRSEHRFANDNNQDPTFFEESGTTIFRPKVNDGIYVTAKGNTASGHAHADVGSFVVLKETKLLLTDAGAPVYRSTTFGPTRNLHPYVNTWGHSAPIVNDRPQLSTSTATNKVIRSKPGDTINRIRFDLSNLYADSENVQIIRTIDYDNSGHGLATITDRFHSTKSVSLNFGLVTQGNWELNGAILTISSGSNSISVQLEASATPEFEPSYFSEDGLGYWRLSFVFRNSLGDGYFSTKISPASSARPSNTN